MKSRSEKGQGTQVKGEVPLERLRQLLLPMVAGISATKQHMVDWVHSVGLEALSAVLHESAESIAGQKGGRQSERAANHWGKARTELPFGGRRIVIERPRVMSVRDAAGRRHELALPAVEHFKTFDPLPERVVNQWGYRRAATKRAGSPGWQLCDHAERARARRAGSWSSAHARRWKSSLAGAWTMSN